MLVDFYLKKVVVVLVGFKTPIWPFPYKTIAAKDPIPDHHRSCPADILNNAWTHKQ